MTGLSPRGHVAISVSDPDDVDAATVAALDELFVDLAGALLEAGYGLAYGGDLRLRGFTDRLLDLAAAAAPGRLRLVLAPFVAAAAGADELDRARQRASVEVVDVGAPPAGLSERGARALELTAMRERISSSTDARVVVGGKVVGSIGAAPGVLEEAYLSAAAGKAVIAVGGYGGVGQIVADAMRGRSVDDVAQRLVDDPGYREVLAELQAAGHEPIDSAAMLAALRSTRSRLGAASLQELADLRRPDRVIELVLAALAVGPA